jgi:hypothetical protein
MERTRDRVTTLAMSGCVETVPRTRISEVNLQAINLTLRPLQRLFLTYEKHVWVKRKANAISHNPRHTCTTPANTKLIVEPMSLS